MLSTFWNTLFYEPIMNSLLFFYFLFGSNLGLAIVMVTVILRAVMFPFMKSQFDSSRKLKEIQPQMEKIKKKYSRNPKKVQEEQMKLYKNAGYNPLGCFFSMLIPFPFMIAIYQAIRNFSSGEAIEGVYNFIINMWDITGEIIINTQFFGLDLSLSYLPLAREYGYVTLWIIPYLIVALLVGVSQYFSVKFNQGMMGAGSTDDKKDKKDKKKDDKKKKDKKDEAPGITGMMGDMSKNMMYTFPVMTTFIALSLPLAVSIYWILQSWVPVGMYQLYNKFIKKDEKKDGKSKGKK